MCRRSQPRSAARERDRAVPLPAASPIYELDIVLDAIARLRTAEPGLDARLELYGRDFDEVPLRDQAARLGLADRVTFHGRIPIDAVPAAIAAADIGLAPTRRSAFTDYSLSTKAFEYAAMGRPVIASRLPMVEAAFGDDVVTYEPGDADDLARAIGLVVDDATARDARVVARRRSRPAAVVGGGGRALRRARRSAARRTGLSTRRGRDVGGQYGTIPAAHRRPARRRPCQSARQDPPPA